MAAAAAAAVCQLYRARPALLTNALAVIDSYDCAPPARPRSTASPPNRARIARHNNILYFIIIISYSSWYVYTALSRHVPPAH